MTPREPDGSPLSPPVQSKAGARAARRLRISQTDIDWLEVLV
jgi:hypothetical protein